MVNLRKSKSIFFQATYGGQKKDYSFFLRSKLEKAVWSGKRFYDVQKEKPLSREGRPSSPHTALAGAICALHSEFFTSEALKSVTLLPTGSTIVGAKKSLQFRRRQVLSRSFNLRYELKCIFGQPFPSLQALSRSSNLRCESTRCLGQPLACSSKRSAVKGGEGPPPSVPFPRGQAAVQVLFWVRVRLISCKGFPPQVLFRGCYVGRCLWTNGSRASWLTQSVQQ